MNSDDEINKLVILGSGCAGLTAAMYAARANLNPIVLEGPEKGGQIALTTMVENFPGFPDGILGGDLLENMKKQAEKFGAKFISEDASSFTAKGEGFEIGYGDKILRAKSVIIATGASARWLGLESEKKYIGRGVSTCATCDAYFFKGKKVAVIGGGDGACEEALFLSKYADKIIIIHRRDKLRAGKIMQDRVFSNKKIDFIWNHEVVEVLGDGNRVTGLEIKNTEGKISEINVDGMFLGIGHKPNTEIFQGSQLELDETGLIKTDRRTRTSIPGVFACGDVQDSIYRQAITASASGCQAAMEAERFIEGIGKE